MSGDDEDRLDFGEDEELEDQISLGDADETDGWQKAQQQEMQVDTITVEQSTDTGSSKSAPSTSQAANEASGSEEPLPAGWVTRVSRQGEMYYFHEATLMSQWDRPTAPVNGTSNAVDTSSSEATSAQPVQQAAAASKSQDTSTKKETNDTTREAVTSSKWGRRSQPLQDQAFTSRPVDTASKPKSAREVAEAAAARQATSNSGTSRLPAGSDRAERPSSGRASPVIPTGPRSAREAPNGPRSHPQDSAQWPSRESLPSQSKASTTLPTGPAADRNRRREPPTPADRLATREATASAQVTRSGNAAHRGDTGWPVREPVGPPADLSRASAAGFREPPPSRDVRDKDYEGGRRPARNEPLTRERDAEFGYRNTSTAAPRESRGPPRQDGDQGWSRRALPQDPRTQNASRRRDPSPPRRTRSPLPVRREPGPLAERRRRSPSPPPRDVRDLSGPSSRPVSTRPVSREDSDNTIRTIRRGRRSPSPPPMRKWAVRALTPPTASDEAAVPQKTSEQEAESQPSTEGETGQGQAQVGDMRSVKADLPLPSSAKLDGTLTNAAYAEKSTEAQPVESDSMSGQPSVDPPKPNDTADKRSEASTNPPPIKREKRPESPGLASRLDRPLSQPTSREARSRRGRTPPPIQSSRRSPSPDIQRKRSVLQPGPSLADRMTGGRAGETSLLSRLDNNGKSDNNRRREPPQDSRPLKRSKKDENKDSMRNSGEMQVDSDQLANRVQASRARSQSPPPSSRGIAILGASRNRPAAPSGEPEKMNVTAASNARPDKGAQEREALKAGPGMVASEAPQGTPEEPKPKDTSTASSNGLPARPAGFASLPPKPPVVVPPPSFTTRGPPRGGSSTPNPALLDSYRPGPPPRRSSARGPPPLDPYQSAPPKDAPLIDRYVPRRDPPPAHGPRRSPPPYRGPPRRDFR